MLGDRLVQGRDAIAGPAGGTYDDAEIILDRELHHLLGHRRNGDIEDQVGTERALEWCRQSRWRRRVRSRRTPR